jgi:hypothetical protein
MSKEIVVNPLIYYQKPAIGQDVSEERTPVQLVFPSGGFGLGLKPKDVEVGLGVVQVTEQEQHNGILASMPLASPLDVRQVKEYKLALCALALVSLVISCLLFFQADAVDVSKVAADTGMLPSAFSKVPSDRRSIERINFAFYVLMLCLGTVSAVFEQATGLSAFTLGLLLNFFLGTSALPYFVYSLRYVLDFALLYVALVLRSRLQISFLVLNPHRL